MTGSDFAGNMLDSSTAYRSTLPAVASGGFEAGGGWNACDPAIAPDFQTCVGAAAPAHDDVLALAGTRSLFSSRGSVTLRIARASGASKLLSGAFARLRPQRLALRSHIQALDAGSSASASHELVTGSSIRSARLPKHP